MQNLDLWTGNVLVLKKFDNSSRVTVLFKEYLSIDSPYYSLLKNNSAEIFIISDDLYKRLFDLSDKELKDYKSYFDYDSSDTSEFDELFKQFSDLVTINGQWEICYFLSPELNYGTLTVNENGEIELVKNPNYGEENFENYIKLYKKFYKGEFSDDEIIDICTGLFDMSIMNDNEKIKKL